MQTTIPEHILRATYERHKKQHPHWPKTFEGVLLDDLTSRVLVALSRVQVPAYQRKVSKRWNGPKTPDGAIDMRRASSNDKDD